MSQPRLEQLTISGAVGPIAVSLFYPDAAGRFPGVVLLHEGSGVTQLAAGVIFYGRTPEHAELARLGYPLLGHYAERDAGITSSVSELERRLSPLFRAFIYPGTEHGFFNEERASYQRESSALAYQRTLAFLAERVSTP